MKVNALGRLITQAKSSQCCGLGQPYIVLKGRSDPRTGLVNLSNDLLKKPENSGSFNGNPTHDLCDAGVMLYHLRARVFQCINNIRSVSYR